MGEEHMGRAGFAKVLITPPLSVELCGYGVDLERRSTEVNDDLFVRALVLEDDAGERALLLTLDLVGLAQEVHGAIVRQAEDALGLDAGRVMVSCTHTHSGPATALLYGWGKMEPSYVETLPGRCVEAARTAVARVHDVRVGSTHGVVRALGFNRVRPDGPIDPGIHALRIDDTTGTPEVVLFSHGCHPVSIDQRAAAGTAISADWPGQVARRLRDEGYGDALFRLGACGDIDPVVAWHNFGFEGAALSAEVVTQTLVQMLTSVETSASLRLRVAQSAVALPLQPLTERAIAATLSEAQTRYGSVHVSDASSQGEAWQRFYHSWAQAMRAQLRDQPDHLTVSLWALAINDEVWLHLPGEVFTALSCRIQERSPFPTTVVTTLAGPFIGYIPDQNDFASGGYASTLTPRILRMPPYSPAVGDALVDSAVQLLHHLGGIA